MPAQYSAGSIFLQVIPSFRGVPEEIGREARKWEKALDDNFKPGEKIAKSVKESTDKIAQEAGRSGAKAGDVFTNEFIGNQRLRRESQKLFSQVEKDAADSAKRGGKKSGDEYAGTFAEGIKKVARAVEREIGSIKLTGDDNQLQGTLRQVKRDISALTDAKNLIGLDLDPGTAMIRLRELEDRLRAIQDATIDVQAKTNFGAAFLSVAKLREDIMRLSALQVEPEVKLDAQVGQFERTVRNAVNNALKNIPPVNLDVDPSDIDREIAHIRQELFSLSDVEIDADFDSESVLLGIANIQERLGALVNSRNNIDLDVNALAAISELNAVWAQVQRLRDAGVKIPIEVQNAMDATAQIRRLGDETTRAGRSGDDTANAFRAFQFQILGIAAAGPAAIPALIGLTAALGAAGPLAAAGAAGLGVMALGLYGVGDAFKAMGEASTNSAREMAAHDRQVRNAAQSVSQAERAIADARADAARSSEQASRQVQDALEGVEDAERGVGEAREAAARASEQARRQVEDALRGVVSAERGVADARREAAEAAEQASRQVQNALRGVESAELDVQDAQRAAQRAQEDLTRARADAREEMEDLALSVRGGALAERDAILDLREAERELAAARAEGVSGDDMERFILDLDQARLRLDQVRESNGDLALEQAEMARTGIEGTRGVIDARERLGDANRGVADAERALSDAHREVADARANETRVALEGQRRIGEAQLRLADAQREVADARANETRVALDGQRRVQEAQERLAESHEAVADARANEARVAADGQARISEAQARLADAQADYNDLISQGTASTRKLEEAMAKLGPAGQAFVTYLHGLRPVFDQFRSIAQEGFLPGFQSWIDSMVGHHGPLLRETIGGISRALGDMFQAFGNSFKGPEFTALFEMINRSGPAFIGMMSDVLVNLGEGVASLIVAMEPMAYLFGQWLVDATARFSEWAASLRGSSGLTEFFEYVMRIGPEIGAFFSALGGAILNLAVALAPYGEAVMNILTGILELIEGMDPQVLGATAAGLFALVTGLQLVFGATAAAAQLTSAVTLLNEQAGRLGFSLGNVVKGFGFFIAAAAVVGASFFYLYQTSEDFRAVIDGLWDVLQPIIGLIGDVLVGTLESLDGILQVLAPTIVTFAAIWAGWKIISLISGYVGGLATGLSGLGHQAYAASQQTGGFRGAMEGIGVAADGARGKLSGVMNALGGPWMLGLAGASFVVGLFTTEIMKNEQQAKTWAEGLRAGGKSAADAMAGLNAERAKYSDNWFGDLSYELDSLFNLAVNIEDVREQQRLWWEEATPLERAQAKQAEWAATLSHRLQTLGKDHEDTRIAQERYAFWTGEAETAQRELDSAISGVNIRLLEQQNRALSMAEAGIAFEQSTKALADAHQRVADELAKGGENSEGYRQALQGLESQGLNTANAAGRLAEARHSEADANERAMWGNAAILANLIEQEEKYGALPPHLQTLKSSLEQTITPAQLLQTQIENVGLAILGVPDEKTIVISGDTPQEQLDRLRELGLRVEEDMHGNLVVTGNTELARQVIEDFIQTNWETIITAQVSWARGTFGGKLAGALAGAAGPPRRAAGGPIYGPGTGTSDSILAYVSNGEYVVRADSVQKYGVDFLERINAGKFARGGLVKNGRPAFQAGGMAATWGGTINLSGGDVSPLAQIWYEAIAQIQAGAQQGANVVSGLFASMRDNVVGALSNVRQLVPGQWLPMLQGLESSADGSRGRVLGIFDVLRSMTLGIFDQTRSGVTSTWDDQGNRVTERTGLLQRATAGIFDLLFQTSSRQFSDTRGALTTTWDDQGNIVTERSNILQRAVQGIFDLFFQTSSRQFGDTRSAVTSIWDDQGNRVTDRTNILQRAVQGIFDIFRRVTGEQVEGTNVDVNTRWQNMSNGLQSKTTGLQNWLWSTFGNIMNVTSGLIQAGVSRFDSIWRTLGGIMAGPVNTVITRVLNNGLFSAFNSVIRALGLDSRWTIPTAQEARLAAGGMVPGWSPNDKADNIPAMLTAGEFVLPVSAVEHYGTDFLETLRRKKLPKDEVQYYARGGVVGVPDYSGYATPKAFLPMHYMASAGMLYAAIRNVFPRANLNSGYRAGDPGYHGRNMAIDLGEAGFAGGLGRPYLAAMNRWIHDTYGSAITELIYTGAGDDRPDIKNGRPLNYGAATNAAHRNHVHWAMAGALLTGGAPIVGGGTFGAPAYEPPAWYNLFGSAAGVFQRILNGIGGLDSDVPGRHNSAEIMKGAVRKYPGLMWDKIKGSVDSLFGGVLSMIQSAASAVVGLFGGTNASGPVVDIVRSVAGKYGWGDGNEWNALSRLIQKESSWNPRAQNPTSTAYGLFQFLNGTWAGTGIGKTSDPGLQTEAGLRYIRSRYGSPSRALSFHLANNWYSEGGEVSENGPITPELMDTGGWIHPGLNVIMNKTGRPEPVINPQTLDNLTAIAETGGNALIGQLNLPIMPQATPVEIAGEIMHQVTVASRGGKYA